jgi:integrase
VSQASKKVATLQVGDSPHLRYLATALELSPTTALVIRRRAQLPEVRLHDMRHAYASFGAASGLGLPILGALLGHKTPATTARYAHLANDPLRAVADRIAGEIAAALDGRPLAEVLPLKAAVDAERK